MFDFSICDRIVKIQQSKRISNAELARAVGVHRVSVGQWVKKTNLPTPKVIVRMLLEYQEIDHLWLLTGEGAMIRNVQTNSKILEELKNLRRNVELLETIIHEKENVIKLLIEQRNPNQRFG